MKKMIQDKNSKIKELRERLSKFESVEEEDDWEWKRQISNKEF